VSDVDSSDVTFGGPMFVEGALTHPCHSFAVEKPAMVVVRFKEPPLSRLDSTSYGSRLTSFRRPDFAFLAALHNRGVEP